MNTTPTPIQAQLRSWRAGRNLTQTAAAKALGIPVDTLRAWEQGKYSPSAAAQALINRTVTQEGHQQ